jgi:type I site-specific restriction endonuclease
VIDRIVLPDRHGKREAILEELGLQGVMIDDLVADVGTELDLFDLICHIAFDAPPLSRRDRANQVKAKGYFAQYGDTAKTVLEALLDKYADEGVTNFTDISLLNVQPISQLAPPWKSSKPSVANPNTKPPLKHWLKRYIKHQAKAPRSLWPGTSIPYNKSYPFNLGSVFHDIDRLESLYPRPR